MASVSERGLVSATNPGTTTITAKAGGKEVFYELTVTEKKSETQGTTPSADSKDEKDNKTNSGGAVQTGDTGNFFGIMLAMLTSLSAAVGMTVLKGRKKRMHR